MLSVVLRACLARGDQVDQAGRPGDHLGDLAPVERAARLLRGDGELAAHWRIQTVAERTSDEYAVLLKTLLDMEGFPWRSINAGIISSVVPPTLFGLQQFFKRH